MGRLIDETDLMNLLYALDDARHDLFYAIKKVPELPTVEAIPKDQYENRLKADLVAMLTEIQLEIEENVFADDSNALLPFLQARETCVAIIQQKINSLKENEDETDKSNK